MSSSRLEKLTYWFIFQNDRLLISSNKDSTDYLLTPTAILDLKSTLLRQYKLASFEAHDVYCAELEMDINLPNHITSLPFKKALELLGVNWYSVAAKAYAIINWDKNHQYCGRCGHQTNSTHHGFERVCTSCALFFYPRISPSVIVLIQKEDQLLMARGHHFLPGVYGLIAGFIEAGETVEEAIHREVHEEVGITIKNLHYFGSQSWPFPDSLMLAFIADYHSGELCIDHAEIADADWYRFDALPGFPSSSLSIANNLIQHFVRTQQNKTKDPSIRI